MRTLRILTATVIATMLLSGATLRAQSFRRGGTEFNARRSVSVPPGKAYPVVVCEFLHHGEIDPDRRNVIVATRSQKLVPTRVLQLGPGDFCRLAFQPMTGQSGYDIFYGGDPPTESPPPWTATAGLLLETRRYKSCDLGSLDAVRDAFDSSELIGSDYVESVSHRRNPFSLKPGPFLSRYSGYLNTALGKYGFFTSSQDCSFLLIDGKVIVSAPGRHGAAYRAVPGSRKDVQLSAGRHPFEYYHAATGSSATMVAAWEVSPAGEKSQPKAIPSDAFRTWSIGRLPAGHATLRTGQTLPDFTAKLAGDVPLPDNGIPLIGVRFSDASPKSLTLRADVHWDFGDGQTGDRLVADHVYLRPDVYTVKLSLKRGTKVFEVVNRINVDRPPLTVRDRDNLHELDDYLPILMSYDPQKLDAVALRQLVLAYEAKSLALQAALDEAESRAAAAGEVGNPGRAGSDDADEPRRYLQAAVAAGMMAFLEESTVSGDDGNLYQLAKLVGTMARDRLGDSPAAFRTWQGAARRIKIGLLQAACETEAADVAVNDLLRAPEAKKLLDAAGAHLGAIKTGPPFAGLQRVWGDYYAATGDGKAARKAYDLAEKSLGSGPRYVVRTARRGAHSRSAEEFVSLLEFDRAAAEIRAWQRNFPAEKVHGYLTLLYARYWSARGMYPQAVAQADQLLAVNPDSPYVDQLLALSAACDVQQGKIDRALATLHGLLKDYPGSPLVEGVKKSIARLEAYRAEKPGEPPPANRP